MVDCVSPVPLKGPKVGVLAIQGSYREHISALRRLGVESREVKKPEDLVELSGLIIPGGESTTMAHIAERNGLIPALREFEATKRPIWGTCAGLIFLADRALGQKMGGQALLGGLDCTVHRNFFGSQVNSFETELPAPPELTKSGGPPNFRAVFIRAPAIVETGPDVEVLAEYRLQPGSAPMAVGDTPQDKVEKVAVAVRQGTLMATAFHPELTSDTRWHALFVDMIQRSGHPDLAGVAESKAPAGIENGILRPVSRPADLPVFRSDTQLSFELH